MNKVLVNIKELWEALTYDDVEDDIEDDDTDLVRYDEKTEKALHRVWVEALIIALCGILGNVLTTYMEYTADMGWLQLVMHLLYGVTCLFAGYLYSWVTFEEIRERNPDYVKAFTGLDVLKVLS